MKTVVQTFEDEPDIKIIIGGAPVTQEYTDKIGAHGYIADASEAVKAVADCMGVKPLE